MKRATFLLIEAIAAVVGFSTLFWISFVMHQPLWWQIIVGSWLVVTVLFLLGVLRFRAEERRYGQRR